MEEETIQRKTAAERRTEILVASLEKAAQNEGALLNGTGKLMPQMYGKAARITPSNAIVMSMHSDLADCKTNTYMPFNEVKGRDEAVRKGEKGVPYLWTNNSQYVSNDEPDKVISRAEYKALPDEEKANYRENPREDVMTLFNIDQTTMQHANKDEYDRHLHQMGDSSVRLVGERDDMAMRIRFNDFLLSVKDNLVHVRKDGSGISVYDQQRDRVQIAAQKNYPTYADYAQDVVRQIAQATGITPRLNREGAAWRKPSEQSAMQEALVVELVSAHKMLELGLPAKMKPETAAMLPKMIEAIKENPEIAEKALRDVDRTVGMMKKAENGEKITLREIPSEQRKQQWAAQFPLDRVPESFTHSTMLKDDEGKWTFIAKPDDGKTFAAHPTKEDLSMYFDVIKNDRDEGYTKEFMKQFAQKYYSVVAANPDMEANVFKSQASQDALGLIDKVNAFKSKDGKMMLVATIADEKQHPVEISQSQWQRLWLADDKQDYKTHLAASLYADRLQAALEQGVVNRLKDKPLEKMETAKLLRGDNNEWMLYMKPEAKDGFAVEPSEIDLKRFFSALKKGDEIKADDLLKDMAAKYYPQAMADPSMKRDLFYGDVSTEDKSRIDHASIFRTNDDKFMLSASVEGEGKQQPREITQSQWQRLWFAPDMYEYKRRLSAIVFADVLHKEQSQSQSQPQSQEKDPLQSAARGANALDLESFKSIKAKHPDALLLFRINDTYRSYMKDAEICSKVLGVDTTKQIDGKTGERVAVSEFPHFELDTYLPKLIRAGQRVAICDQVEPAKEQEENAKQSVEAEQPKEKEQEQQETARRGMRR